MKKIVFLLPVCMMSLLIVNAQQVMTLPAILDSVKAVNPLLKMHDYEIRSMDEAAKGARSRMPTEFGAGFFMTPYNVNKWKKMEDGMGGYEEGMGQFMLSAQQMFPNRRKQNAELEYMSAMSSVEAEKKNFSLNQLYAAAKSNYYDWVIIQKKIAVLDQNEALLNFMIQ